jgi:hypothetical protein
LGKEELYGNSSRIRVKKSWKQKWLRKAKFFVVHLWSLKKGFRAEKKYGKSNPAFADEARASDAIVINIQENLNWVQVENFKEGQQGSAIYQSWN